MHIMLRSITTRASSSISTGASRLRVKPPELGARGPSFSIAGSRKLLSQYTSSTSNGQHEHSQGSVVTDLKFWGAIAATGVASLSLGLLLGSRDSSKPSAVRYASQDTMLKVNFRLEFIPDNVSY